VSIRYALYCVVVHHFAVGKRHIGVDMNALVAGEINHLVILQEELHLDLIGEGALGADGVDGLLHIAAGEVGETDGARQSPLLGAHHSGQVVGDSLPLVGRWSVHQG
jgi:hypothetical protein